MNIRLYLSSDDSYILQLFEEFGDYLEAIDPMKRTLFYVEGPKYYLAAMLKNVKEKRGAIFVAEEDGKVVGFIAGHIEVQTDEELLEEKKATPGEISEFFVSENYRKKGSGNALLKMMEEYLKEQGASFSRLHVFAPNMLARDFYKKQGYQDRTIIVSKDL